MRGQQARHKREEGSSGKRNMSVSSIFFWLTPFLSVAQFLSTLALVRQLLCFHVFVMSVFPEGSTLLHDSYVASSLSL